MTAAAGKWKENVNPTSYLLPDTSEERAKQFLTVSINSMPCRQRFLSYVQVRKNCIAAELLAICNEAGLQIAGND